MLKPLNKNVAAKKWKEEPRSGALILKESPQWIFDVVAIADDVTDVAVGDRILIEAFRAVEIEVEGETLYLIPKERIVAILRPQNELD